MKRPGAHIRSWLPVSVLAFAALGSGFTACVDIDGGAVEVPWTVFAKDGRGAINDCSCADPAITYVQLKLAGPPDDPTRADPCAGVTSCRFSCDRKIGATPFIIPPGTYLMSIQPVASDGTAVTTAMVPDPILRQVDKGAPTELDAFEIQAPCALRCHGDDLQMPCSAN
jgi:hypothetical protein